MSIQKSYRSLTRAIHDDCAYKRRLHESTSPLLYQINPVANESCTKCHQAYPGFIGTMGGMGFGIGPDRVDIDSDLRGQTRLLTNCPTHKYNPTSYRHCNCNCENCHQGLPCGCAHCQSRDVSGLRDCRPGIIPIESLDTRSFDACNSQKDQYLNRFDILCGNPQDPNRIFNVPSERVRLGANTRQNMRDLCTNCTDCWKAKLPNKSPCYHGNQGCRRIDNGDFSKGIYL